MMAICKQVTWTLVVGLMGACGSVSLAQAATKHCKTEECACEKALKLSTVEALEDFLKKYPQSTSDTRKTACAALGVPGLEGEGIISGDSREGSQPLVDGLASGG